MVIFHSYVKLPESKESLKSKPIGFPMAGLRESFRIAASLRSDPPMKDAWIVRGAVVNALSLGVIMVIECP